MEADGLAGLGFEGLVEIDRVFVQLADGVAHVEERQEAGGVPGGAGGQLGLLDQDDVGPAALDEVIKRADADDSAADHHHARMALHGRPAPLTWSFDEGLRDSPSLAPGLVLRRQDLAEERRSQMPENREQMPEERIWHLSSDICSLNQLPAPASRQKAWVRSIIISPCWSSRQWRMLRM